MTATHDIRTRDDVIFLVEGFYARVFADPLIGPVFTDIAHVDMRIHGPIMCDFWETVLFRAGSYRGNAFVVHRTLHERHRLTPTHFARWLDLWIATVDDCYAGPVAEHAKIQADRIAMSISKRLNRSRSEPVGCQNSAQRPDQAKSSFRAAQGPSAPGG